MTKNILLIEYEQRDRTRVRSLLDPAHFSVTETHDGEEGLAAFADTRFDLVLLSGKLPRLTSNDVIREIRKKGGAAAPPIVLLAGGYSGSNTKADAQQIGAFEIVPKPFTDDALLTAVRSALDTTERGAKTMKISTGSLTAADIFADLLDELGRDSGAAPPKTPAAKPSAGPPMPPAPPPTRPRPTVSDDMERRLRDTLSGVRETTRPGAGATAPTRPQPPPATGGPPSSRTGDDIDRMLTETLRIKIPKVPPAPAARLSDATPTGSRRAEPVEAVAPSGPDRFGQYELLERVASGGMAELFRARRTGVEGFQKIVAIKKILPHIADNDEFITMFADEAKLAAQLNHPNIVHIYDLGKIQAGGYFIAMEYVDGTDLRSVLAAGRDTGRSMPVPLAVYVASKVASALDYAHRRRDSRGEDLRIVHRDVSPQNILISHEGEIKLCDFGIAKADRKVSKTESGSLKGKLQYMSPEQAWGRAVDHRSDLFSLGSVLHEMLTGERVFRGDSDLMVLEMVRKAEVLPPSRTNPEVPPSLDSIVLRALARDPNDRYPSGSELLRDLESILYSYSPAPGSADLAIYLNHLREAAAAPAAVAHPAPERAAVVAPSPAAPEPAPAPAAAPKRKKGKAAKARPPIAAPAPPAEPSPVATKAPVQPPAAEGGREVFASFSPVRLESEKKNRTPLYIGIAAAALLGTILAVVLSRRGTPVAPSASAPTPIPAAAVPAAFEAPPLPTPAAAIDQKAIDQRAIEQEVQRKLAEKRQEMQTARETPGRAPAAPKQAAVSTPLPTEAPVARVEPTELPLPTPAPVEPTEVAVVAPPPEPTEVVTTRENPPAPARASAPAPAPEAEVSRGDLVGPGPGVVEPSLVSSPKIAYPPMARQQRVSGRVVILVLVNENGGVVESRLQKGIGGRSGIDAIVLDAVRSARFRPATKNGIPVKMWRTVVVDVKP